MKPTLKTKTLYLIECPHCNEGEFNYSHLRGGSTPKFGPWYCDKCGHSISGKIENGEVVEIEKLKEVRVKYYSLLALEPQSKPVYFVVETGMPGGWSSSESTRLFFEESQCPTNFVRAEAIVFDGDTDPHGIFEFRETHQVSEPGFSGPSPFDNKSQEEFEALFPETFSNEEFN